MAFTQTQFAAQAPLNANVVCLEFRPCDKGTLKGFAKIEVPAWGLVLDGVAVHDRGDRAWAQLPARPQLGPDGAALRDEATGKVKYCKIMEFTDKRKAYPFSDEVVAAVQKKRAAQ